MSRPQALGTSSDIIYVHMPVLYQQLCKIPKNIDVGPLIYEETSPSLVVGLLISFVHIK